MNMIETTNYANINNINHWGQQLRNDGIFQCSSNLLERRHNPQSPTRQNFVPPLTSTPKDPANVPVEELD